MREHLDATSTIDFVPEMKEITTNYEEGSSKNVKMHDGSVLQLNKLAKDWDPMNRQSVANAMMIAKSKGEILTGLLYMSPNTVDLHNTIQTNDRALNSLTKKDLCPGNEILKTINAEFR